VWPSDLGEILSSEKPQALFGDETLEQAIRQLVLYGPTKGLPVVSRDEQQVMGWVTYHDVLRSMAERMSEAEADTVSASLAAEWAVPGGSALVRVPSLPLEGYDLVEVRLSGSEANQARRVQDVVLPFGGIAVAVRRDGKTAVANCDDPLYVSDVLLCLIPTTAPGPSRPITS